MIASPTGSEGKTGTSSASAESFRFHTRIESLGSFVRREWRFLAFCGGVYAAVMTTILLIIDPAVFYARIETDHLLYLLKAKSLAVHGTLAARTSVNLQPFSYISGPAAMRAPFMLFEDFDAQLRAIQLFNVLTVVIAAVLAAFILSWSLPRSYHKHGILFVFAFVFFSPDWLSNVFVPLADAPYAVLTLGCLVLSTTVIASPRPIRSQLISVAVLAILFCSAFFFRYTAPVLLVYAGFLARGRWRGARFSPVARTMTIVAPLVLLALLILTTPSVMARYMTEPFVFLAVTPPSGFFLTLFGAAIPSQLLPVFNQGFQLDPWGVHLVPVFGTTTRDVAWTSIGVLISAVCLLGVWRSRKRLLPEIAYVAAALPVLTIMVPSTTRYLMAYQPIIWSFYLAGFAALTAPWHARLANVFRSRLVQAGVCVAIVVAVVALRFVRTAGGAVSARSLSGAQLYFADVGSTYRELREYLETLPADRTLLIGERGNVGRWTVIANRNYYSPDEHIAKIVAEKDVFVVRDCGSAAACAGFDSFAPSARPGRLTGLRFEEVFVRRGLNSRAAVDRVYSASGRALR